MKEPLKPIELQLGNFIESMGKIEMVTGVVTNENGTFQIAHHGWHKGTHMIPDDVLMSTFPIPLTDQWKKCFNIEKFEKLPEWILYVHQCQNYFMWALQINVHDIMNWNRLPKQVEIDID